MKEVKKISKEIKETVMKGVTEEERRLLTGVAEKVTENLEQVL